MITRTLWSRLPPGRCRGVLRGMALPFVAVGFCLGRIGWWSPSKALAGDELTYGRQISRIVQNRCLSCHRSGGVAPFPLDAYEQVKNRAATIRTAVEQGRMPPWHADPAFGRFSNDRSLAPKERDDLLAWIDSGLARGEDADLPPAVEFPKDWAIGRPDRILSLPQDFVVPAEGVLDYQRILVDPQFTEEVFVQRAEARPGSPAVHHILVYIREPGKPEYDALGNTTVLCGTAPGDMPTILPDGMAKKIPAGAKLIFEVHYTPIGREVRDRSSIGLIFAKETPKQEVHTNILAKLDIRIPPETGNHKEESYFRFPYNMRVLSLMPHMHVRGKSFEYRIHYPDGRAETLLRVPRFDFNWQSVYRFADPPLIPKGARLQCIAHWDNSSDNPLNPDSKKTITYGLQTWDEMMNGWMDYVIEP